MIYLRHGLKYLFNLQYLTLNLSGNNLGNNLENMKILK